jgi:hypothetical protein
VTGVREAVRQNASWCARVCEQHGVATRDDGRLLVTAGPPPPFYPHAMTLAAAVRADDVAAAVAGRQECGVKDSFAVLDLSGAGFTVLFEASWLVLDPTGAARGRDVVGPDAPGPDVVTLGSAGAGCVAHRSGGVIGLQDVVTGGDPQLLVGLVADARERQGALPVVGYEHGDDLTTARAAGFREVGPLRVWVR